MTDREIDDRQIGLVDFLDASKHEESIWLLFIYLLFIFDLVISFMESPFLCKVRYFTGRCLEDSADLG